MSKEILEKIHYKLHFLVEVLENTEIDYCHDLQIEINHVKEIIDLFAKIKTDSTQKDCKMCRVLITKTK